MKDLVNSKLVSNLNYPILNIKTKKIYLDSEIDLFLDSKKKY